MYAGRCPGGVIEIFIAPDAEHRHGELIAVAEAAAIPVHRVAATDLAALSGTVTPQGVVAVCAFLDVPLTAVLATSPRSSNVRIILASTVRC